MRTHNGQVNSARAPLWQRAVLCLALGTLAACADDPTARERPAPSSSAETQAAEWRTAPPAELGLDPGVLEDVAAAAGAGRSKCLLVVRDGRIAGEWYFDGTGAEIRHPVFSVTKSITSTLVGVAQDEGVLDVEDPAADWIPSWAGTPSGKVAVRNLLANDSGREWSTTLDYSQLVRSADMTRFAVGLGQSAPPGTTWAYNNSAIQTLEAVLQSATGEDVAAYAREHVFGPLGMDDTFMAHDAAANAMVYAGVTSTCRDLARFGLMMLGQGRSGDHQIVSSQWVESATGRSSTRLNAAYGYLWWLNRRGPLLGPLPDSFLAGQQAAPRQPRGRLVPGAPADIFWAIGLGNQIVQVDPGSGTVVVRLGDVGGPRGPAGFGPDDTARVVTEGVVAKVP